MQGNDRLRESNRALAEDIASASAHMENLSHMNHLLRGEMEEQLRQDEAIIAILRRKRLIPS